jgi:O-antigen/teichoic acid export membrane protein
MKTTNLSLFFNGLTSLVSNRIKKIIKHGDTEKIVSSISWLFFDKLIRIVVGLFLIAWVARYLGPENFGILNYSLAFVSIISAFAGFGIDAIVVREIIKRQDLANSLLGSAFALKVTGSALALIISIIIINVIRPNDTLMLYLVIIGAVGILFQAFLLICTFKPIFYPNTPS